MTAISKAWVSVADSAVDPDSPLDSQLMTGLRDDLIGTALDVDDDSGAYFTDGSWDPTQYHPWPNPHTGWIAGSWAGATLKIDADD